MQINSEINSIFKDHSKVIDLISNSEKIKSTIYQIITELVKCINSNNKILLAGNGGSAADSQHMSSELVGKLCFERDGIPAISLASDIAIITSISNDISYENIFARQIKALCREGDVVLLYSTSGKSKNILEAIKQTKLSKGIPIGFTGMNGKIMHEKCDHCIEIPNNSTQRIQEAHHLINHIICEIVEKKIFNN